MSSTERCWNMWIPGFGSEELKPYKKSATTEAHKQVRFVTHFRKIENISRSFSYCFCDHHLYFCMSQSGNSVALVAQFSKLCLFVIIYRDYP